MGRLNRSRKRKDKMNRVKRVRNAKKELIRLKKTLGIVDVIENINENDVEVLTLEEIKEKKRKERVEREKEEAALLIDEKDFGEEKLISVVNENTKKVHIYNTKTLRDQFGTLPPWHRPRHTAKRLRKKEYAMKKNFNQAWNAKFVPI